MRIEIRKVTGSGFFTGIGGIVFAEAEVCDSNDCGDHSVSLIVGRTGYSHARGSSHTGKELGQSLTNQHVNLQGSNITSLICVLNQANNLLSVVNATIPFFVFLMCNEQFKYMTVTYLKARLDSLSLIGK